MGLDRSWQYTAPPRRNTSGPVIAAAPYRRSERHAQKSLAPSCCARRGPLAPSVRLQFPSRTPDPIGCTVVRSSAFTRPLIACREERAARGEAAVKAELQTELRHSLIVRSVLSRRWLTRQRHCRFQPGVAPPAENTAALRDPAPCPASRSSPHAGARRQPRGLSRDHSRTWHGFAPADKTA